ncbi:GNAT family N-acetyltransferase [Paenibacillus dokdonensis]|uniref:GNAT family N-acetyltransferase n=1 Tax=Paenibacillus dokdonensis TaxID=2567944 RepID=UPI0010A7E348|nr:GNAT family N-acetyltransferase [Paenibacillus dokdonensis]
MSDSILPQLVMIHEQLSLLPEISNSEPYRLAAYQPGHEAAWEAIIGESFQSPFSFEEFMKKDVEFRPERIIILWKGDQPVATASAWHQAKLGSDMGYLHMVGIMNAYAGQGLGQKITHAALIQMRNDGGIKALLNTDDFRISAIKTYLRLGFVPKLSHESHGPRWKEIANQLQDPEMKRTIAARRS